MLDFKNAIVKEAERLISPPNDECKPEGMGTVRFVCQTNGDCREVIEKAKAVLQVVNRHSQGNWPDDEQWTQVLPKEFVAEFGPEMTAEAAEEEMARRRTLSLDQQANSERTTRWSMSNWIFWLQPDQRLWFWWDAAVLTEHDFVVAVETHEWPFPSGALKWLLRACGADTVEAEI